MQAVKRKFGEEPLLHLDARTMAARFRSKHDLYAYLDQHRKTLLNFLLTFSV